MQATTERKANGTVITGIDMAGYLVRDPDRAIAFYRDVLGIAPTEIDEQGRGAEFTLPDGSTFGVWRPEDGKAGGFAMFSVKDVYDAVAGYRARGLKLSDVMETPVCYLSWGEDPEGNAILIHQRK